MPTLSSLSTGLRLGIGTLLIMTISGAILIGNNLSQPNTQFTSEQVEEIPTTCAVLDPDGDGELDQQDITNLNNSLGTTCTPPPFLITCGTVDTNLDGTVDDTDQQEVLRLLQTGCPIS